MKIIVGLGNPGREYTATRHNVGFMVVDELARRLAAGDMRTRFRAEVREAFDRGDKIVLIKPQTYMNLSGVAVREATRWYKAPVEDVMVVSDDIDLPFGTLRMRASGSSGGHNGLKSVFAEMGSLHVPRLRIGVGRGSGHATRQVLTRFTPDESRQLPEIVAAAADCVLDWERKGLIEAMNRCNRRPEPSGAADAAGQIETSTDVNSLATRRVGQPGVMEHAVAVDAYNRVREWLRRRIGPAGVDGVDRHQ